MSHPFTEKQIKTIQVVADGKLNKKEGREYTGLSISTMNHQLFTAREILGVRSTLHLVAECLRKGWID